MDLTRLHRNFFNNLRWQSFTSFVLYNLSSFLLEGVLSVPEGDPGDRLLLPPHLEHHHRLLTVSAQVSPDNSFQVETRTTTSSKTPHQLKYHHQLKFQEKHL
jgi:hypothetical protein